MLRIILGFGLASAAAFSSKRIPYLRFLGSSVMWRLRVLLHSNPLPRDLAGWEDISTDNDQQAIEHTRKLMSYWIFLKPFFELKGYDLFEPMKNKTQWCYLVPCKSLDTTKRRSDYPYARKCYAKDEELRFLFSSTRVWPARDIDGNDLMVRLISGSEPSDELRIWQRLHSPALKNHPRNRAIPVLEFVEFDGLIFIVMPRWGSLRKNDFGTAEEVLNMAESILDFVDFLHEHRIVHRDLDSQNMAMNVVNNENWDYSTGNHDPKHARYAVIDFGFSLIYPYETKLDSVTTTLRYGWETGEVQPPRNPFKLEAYRVVERLQFNVRVVEKFIPEIGPFFDDILSAHEADRPFAAEVLRRFRELKASLTPEQLATPLEYRYWVKGKFHPKKK
ncbi:hypothetical protein CVT24_005089 [Panaeolus cyanescens]|uniref:Protein kinase domain-containing protein n=1 Tax=Panaeolus cyanescens TaxID=181874 RepID=A0A409W246_9AGAR|nr:hypothetical protein CVT24_005089 [Panaeolus cyanescens]